MNLWHKRFWRMNQSVVNMKKWMDVQEMRDLGAMKVIFILRTHPRQFGLGY